MVGRSTPKRSKLPMALGAVAAAIVLVGAGIVAFGLPKTQSGSTPTPATQIESSALGASEPAPGAVGPGSVAPSIASSQPGAQGAGAGPSPAGPPAAGNGDHYVHNVQPNATCAPADALGFTADVTSMRCTTTTTDPQLRWRKS
jgi:hypothetical protein